jgi:hypothetical protein
MPGMFFSPRFPRNINRPFLAFQRSRSPAASAKKAAGAHKALRRLFFKAHCFEQDYCKTAREILPVKTLLTLL